MRALLRYLRTLPVTLWLYWGFLLALLYGFALLAEEVVERERFAFDRTVLDLLARRRSAGLDRMADLLDVVGGAYVILPVGLVATVLLWRKRRRSGAFFGLSVLGVMGLNLIAKLVFERTRPDRFEALVPADGYAFPSGHAMASAALALAAFFVVRFHAPRWRWPALVLGVLFALAVGLSRSYVQVHYPSDVLAGWTLAVAWVLGVNAWHARARR